ncbi:MAG: hypothetical protein AB2L12_13225 [Smithellaceae bacterium]|jgi:hypothetical protein
MKLKILLILKIGIALILLAAPAFSADECFNSSKKLNEDAQTIRLKALDMMGWKVSKTASLAAASIVKGKSELYPKDSVEICIREEGSDLQIKAQSKSRDAGKAEWHKIMGKHIGKSI